MEKIEMDETKASKCPGKLKQLIADANSLPGDLSEPKEFNNRKKGVEPEKRLFDLLVARLPAEFLGKIELVQKYLKGETEFYDPFALDGMLEDWPKKNVAYWWFERYQHANGETIFSPPTLIEREISRVRSSRKLLLQVIDDLSKPEGTIIYEPIPELEERMRALKIPFKDSGRSHVQGRQRVGNSYEMVFEHDFGFIYKDGIDLRRIHLCAECEKFSWIKKFNVVNPSDLCRKCSAAYRAREKRKAEKELNPAKISIERRSLRNKNKGIRPICDTCGHPDLSKYPDSKCECSFK